MAVGAGLLAEALFQRGAEFRQVEVAVNAAELVIGFEHSGGAPAQRIVPSALDVLGVFPADLRNWLDRTMARAGLRDVDGQPLRFTPHDFAACSTTDVINSG